MYNLGEEIVLESHRIPWLILIQLIILLLLLLSFSGLFSLDLAGAAVSSSPSKISSAVVHQEAGGSQERQEETQIERAQTERARESEVNAAVTPVSEGSSQKDFQRFIHPCFYLDLARKAFFQCLGLGSMPPDPRERASEE